MEEGAIGAVEAVFETPAGYTARVVACVPVEEAVGEHEVEDLARQLIARAVPHQRGYV
jgi:hypothetical protein